MKTKLFPAALLAGAVALSFNAFAADNKDGAPTAQSTKAPPPHSHVQEKTGVPPKAKTSDKSVKDADKDASTDKSKHFHPRDR
jgi:hypothetical protein